MADLNQDISMTYDSALQIARAIDDKRTEFNGMRNTLDNLVNQIQNQWEGAAQLEFMTAYNKLKPKLKTISEAMEQYSKAIRSTVNAEAAQEKESSKLFKGLEKVVIPLPTGKSGRSRSESQKNQTEVGKHDRSGGRKQTTTQSNKNENSNHAQKRTDDKPSTDSIEQRKRKDYREDVPSQTEKNKSRKNEPFSEKSVHDYSDGVTRGTIRYVNQAPSVVTNIEKDSDTGLTQGWRDKDLKKGSGSYLDHQCNWACESMAFSYLGIDQPPCSMHDSDTLKSFEFALGVSDGNSATFNAVDGSANVVAHTNGWGASFNRKYLDSLVDNFAQDAGNGSQSPVLIHYSVPDSSKMHWILLTGKNADGTYHAIGPWSEPNGINERIGFDISISDSGVISGSGFSHCKNTCRIDCIGQYTRTN